MNELSAQKEVTLGEPFEIVFTTNQPGAFKSCGIYKPGGENNSPYLEVTDNTNNVTR